MDIVHFAAAASPSNFLTSESIAPLIIGLLVILVVIKLVKSIINRIISIAVAAVILGGGQQAGLFEGLGNFFTGR